MIPEQAVEAAVGQRIRSCHHYQYKSGLWGIVSAVVPARGKDMWLVSWPDGDTDIWNPEDLDAHYELGVTK